jgi:2-dehydro-3-deoxy-D-arabinonate dehydratase
MILYRTAAGYLVEHERGLFSMEYTGEALTTREDLVAFLNHRVATVSPVARSSGGLPDSLLPPVANQEVWAAGVTYYRSRDARMEESKAAGGGSFYDRLYRAERPELFFKATPNRVVGHRGIVAIRQDSSWSVPEPELALLISPGGTILGYTVGNDMSARDIEGENPLYLPQAKIYDRCCALGPGILVSSQPLPPATEIRIAIVRGPTTAFAGSTTLSSMKRDPAILVEYLFRNNVFPNGCFLLTGTGIVPPDPFRLQNGDEIRITIEGLGTLVNFVG